jgi:hypothetical protein
LWLRRNGFSVPAAEQHISIYANSACPLTQATGAGAVSARKNFEPGGPLDIFPAAFLLGFRRFVRVQLSAVPQRLDMDHRGLRILLVVHGVITLAASIVLVVAPGLIPSVVGIDLEPEADVLAYLLAGAELGLAVLSFGASRVTDYRALRLIVWSLIAFHGSSGVLEIYAYLQGAGVAIIGNVAARAIIVILFAWLSRKPAKLD